MQKITFNIQEVTVADFDGKPYKIPGLDKLLGNYIYKNIQLLEWLPTAKAIHAGQPVALSHEEAQALIQLISEPQCLLTLMVKDALITYITNLLNQTEHAEANETNGTKNNGRRNRRK